MIQEKEEKHPMSTHMDTNGVLNSSVNTCFSDKIRLNWINACLI